MHKRKFWVALMEEKKSINTVSDDMSSYEKDQKHSLHNQLMGCKLKELGERGLGPLAQLEGAH